VKRLAFAIPGDLESPTGGYGYDRRMIAELRRLGWQVDVTALGDGFPRPTDVQRTHALAVLNAVPDGVPILIDGLAFGVLPEAASSLRTPHRLIALVHHPLALETGISQHEVTGLRASERAALLSSWHVVVTSATTRRILVDHYEMGANKISVVRPGTERVLVEPRASTDIVQLIAVGSIVPRKGYDVLIAALAQLKGLAWHLSIVGDPALSPDTATVLHAGIVRNAMTDKVSVLGRVSEAHLSELYASSDVFVLASHFEGYGMAYAEAIAHGLPVVGTTGGAIPEVVTDGAGLLVPPGDVAALAAALRTTIEDADQRGRLTQAARFAASKLPTWQESARTLSRAIEAGL
jgi:glycosyltransferase involved in cell wall biosynthesis